MKRIRQMVQLVGATAVVAMGIMVSIVPAAAQNAPSVATVSLSTLLQEMTDVEAIARWPQLPYTNREASSYDRRTMAPDKPGWWANDDFSHFIRTEENAGRQEKVMMEAEGPGALVRFWLTSGRPKDGTLRIYLDRSTTPSLTFSAFDLEKGGLEVPSSLLYRHDSYSNERGGNTLYLPVPYAKHCKVTWEEGKEAGQRYYQINYRTYPAGTPVTTWAPEQMEAARGLLESAGDALSSPPQTALGSLTSFNDSLAVGQSINIDLPAGSAAVRSLQLLLDSTARGAEKERAMRSIIVEMTFDGERTVWCPASDFFGTGVGINELRNFYQSVGRDGTMRSRWVMPYRRTARIRLTNLGTAPVQATLHATTSPYQWDERSMLFHANWHYEAGLKTITSNKVMENTTIRDWNFNSIQGRGVYVGDSLSLFNPVATWYGEGDEKLFVDGEAFPSHMGTGTEDYYGYSYAPRPIFQTPFVNHTRIDSPSTQGVNVMGRVRPLDAIPFQRSFNFDIELISWAPTTLTYAATTYWYGFPGAASNIAPDPTAAAQQIQTLADALEMGKLKAGAIEFETLKVVSHSPNFTPETQDMSNWDGSRWSSGKHLLGKSTKVGDYIEFQVRATDDKPRKLIVYATKASNYGILRFSVNGQPSNAVFDGYAAEVEPGAFADLGVFTPQNGKYLLRVQVSGSNPKAQKEGTLFGLDFLELAPL